ncbi:PVC-type heme-binding CxxCH protein [Tuwongella immobilis]|uniref:Cytochrome c domain-containing protein n=1 Tax=Tuwongella immobilis TaxID=692036 RepID=A0A6C2YRA2_9BACT|nr:PVC-type heme-binding CxxCH protein [Tuwongella immobilis]VIP03515.1 membrane-bound dehydrogenase domain-containing protein : Membrane-bound dehydrogenase domain protein OS=Pirellula staleyi (strain ATCC 27377 / DSM 6068 / ICPB 4128) GN=Psta_2212 PE=4 SV=1: HEAT_2: HEAT_2: Cytochrom_C [Tuwongella immobilis]VTS04398.1 membrane-bound dehydrogenase domain-containing protein : Membrane-bound dehydrogenase domain protein OS=Pirellula staleyi (strain ATCC 27377 / DSM 6068 / ICPB 4128) GN=Psta_2212 P
MRYAILRPLLVGFSLLWLVPMASAQRNATVPDPDPEIERKTFQVPEGFEVSLYAADPMLAKPIQMNFDPKGRLWVAASEVYPQVKPGQQPTDKILILEDTNHDGKADKTTVFADGLLIPTGVEPGDGGAYVANSTELLHMADTNGDGKADRTKVMLSGFGTEDTHHIIHTFRWGQDGQLYFNQSIYIHSHLETPFGPRRLLGGGVWMYRPETGRIEVFVRGLVNGWGHHWDHYGTSFLTDGAGGEGINYALPGAYYVTAVGAARTLQGLNPGSPKYCGLETISSANMPDEWQGNLLTNDFRAHRVCRFVLREDGAGFASREQVELIKSNHPAFRPVDIKVGPDGAIYIADWYNPIINHGEVDFRDPRRDKTHGRIWRITYKGKPLQKVIDFTALSTPELLDQLKSPIAYNRQQAKRVLKERGADAVRPELDRWLAALPTTGAQVEHHRLEALWMYQSLDILQPELLQQLLRAGEPRIREAATRVVSQWSERLPNALELLATRVVDEHPRVRLEAVRALAGIPQPRAIELAMLALDKPVDRFLDYALWLTAWERRDEWLPALREGQITFGGNSSHLLFALKAAGSNDVVPPLVALVKAGKVSADSEAAVLGMLANLGGPNELRLVYDRLLASPAARQAPLLAALEQAARVRKVEPTGDRETVLKLLASDNDATRVAAVRLAGRWKLEAAREPLARIASSAMASPSLRQAALDGLLALGGKATLETLQTLAKSADAAIRQQALIAYLEVDDAAAVASALTFLQEPATAKLDISELVTAIATRKTAPGKLRAALEGKTVSPDVAKLAIRAIRATGRPDDALIAEFSKSGSLNAKTRTLSPSEMQQFLADVQSQGNAARGELIFRKSEQQCLKCHGVGGAGGQVGPDLTSIGASAPVDYLVESLLMPNKAIKEGYNSYVIGLETGQVVTGIKVREANGELILRGADGKDQVIPTKLIEERADGKSLMPEGLVDTLTRAELVDLVRFLSELGKLGPYALTKARLVRSWQQFPESPELEKLLAKSDGSFEQFLANGGVPTEAVYSMVSGELPMVSLNRLKLARFQIDVTTAGKFELAIANPQGLRLWVGATPTPVSDRITVDLPVGVHTVTLVSSDSNRQAPYRVELLDSPGSPARVAIVTGK